MSGRGGVGTQQGWRGGRGGSRGHGSGGATGTPWYAADSGRGVHGGFAGAGGGGGGGRRPWRGGDGPKSHQYEDQRRDARVQKNTGRGRGRGRGGRGRGGRGRGGREAAVGPGLANALHTWEAGRTYKQQDMGPRQQIEGVNYDSQRNSIGHGPDIEDGKFAVDGYQRDRLMRSDAQAFEGADVKTGKFVGCGLNERALHSLVSRGARTQPPGSTYDIVLQRRDTEDGPVSSEVVRDRFLSALIAPGDPFAYNANMNRIDRHPPTEDGQQRADVEMEDHIRKESGQAMGYEEEDENHGQPSLQPGYYEGA